MQRVRDRRQLCKKYAYRSICDDMDMTSANLIRQLLKTIIGRYRYIRNGSSISLDSSPQLDRDCRALEEFLISGLTIQRLNLSAEGVTAQNVSPANMFFSKFAKPDASDCILIGMLHDMTPADIYRRFAMGKADRLAQLISIYANEPITTSDQIGSSTAANFDTPAVAEHRRVIEVWEKCMESFLVCHDPHKAAYSRTKYSHKRIDDIDRCNEKRRACGQEPILYYVETRNVWRGYYLSPKGDVLGRIQNITNRHPFVLKAYPLIDGEIHSLVEDVLGQQIYVNKLIQMHDTVLENAAKGALLFPAEQLPDGFSWRDLRRLWSSPGGIIPYKRTVKGVQPQQVQSAGKVAGATDMLELQLRLFDEVAGVTANLRGSTNERGAEAMKRESENASIAMLDMLSAFYSFINQRDTLIDKLNTELK